MTKTPKEKKEVDPWLGNDDETHDKKIMGKTVTFRSKPLTKHFKQLVASAPKDGDSVNFAIMNAVVVEPEITRDEWDTMWVAVKTKILAEVSRLTGIHGESFPE